jgi:hypothetical protein
MVPLAGSCGLLLPHPVQLFVPEELMTTSALTGLVGDEAEGGAIV